MNPWLINRIGLVDFWLYDNEEFLFADGRLLLRGSNGSGKSVTMQSFIPLLLDGNKSPTRLDPFGSTSRQVGNYLLFENDERDERTGYLYMEFKKKDQDIYRTIGMGLRARKNKPLDSWYFIITDNRRIGSDLMLTKDIGEQVALTKRELKNKIESGEGQFFESQRDYMKAVNLHLFGYDAVEDYGELIDLLIQLRSPKLSKDYKPTVLNEILSGSLQPLTDEDLRPMSETIEKIDKLNLQYDSIKSALKSSESILFSYNRYNRSLLYLKASNYKEFQKTHRSLIEQLKTTEESIRSKTLLLEELRAESEKLSMESKMLEDKINKLEQNDAKVLKERELELNELLSEIKKKLESKCESIESKKRDLRIQKDDDEALEHSLYKRDKEVRELLEEMGDFEYLEFDEHVFMSDALLKRFDAEYDFKLTNKMASDLMDILDNAIDVLRQLEILNRRIDEVDEDMGRAQTALNVLLRNRERLEELFESEKLELRELTVKYFNDNRVFKVNEEERKILINIIAAFHPKSVFHDFTDELLKMKNRIDGLLAKSFYAHESELKVLQNQHSSLEEELRTIIAQKDPEPFRSPEITVNRKRLDDLNIPHTPLYRLLEFDENLDGESRDHLEELFMELGILDAQVVSIRYRDSLMKMEPGYKDRYIFVDDNNYINLLSQPLIVTDQFDYRDSLEDLLIQLFSEKTELVFELIGENSSIPGGYRIGISEGVISGTYKHKFIGTESRMRYRQQLIDDLKEDLYQLEQVIGEVEGKLHSVTKDRTDLGTEFNNAPGILNIRTASDQLYECKREMDSVKLELEKHETQLKTLYENGRALQEKLAIYKTKLFRTPNLELYLKMREELNDYLSTLRELENKHRRYIEEIERRKLLQVLIRSITESLEELESDYHDENRRREMAESELLSIAELLNMPDYKSILDELELSISRIAQIPKELNQNTRSSTRLEEQVKFEELSSENLLKEMSTTEAILNMAKEVFEDELKLRLVADKELDSERSTDEIADYVINKLEKVDRNEVDNRKSLVIDSYYNNQASLAEYSISRKEIFTECDYPEEHLVVRRIVIEARYLGKYIGISDLKRALDGNLSGTEDLIRDRDRELFENVLGENLSLKIRAKIHNSKKWVENMNRLMSSMSTSSGLKMRLIWRENVAETEEQMGTRELVEIMNRDSKVLRPEDKEKFSGHFRSKVNEARQIMEQKDNKKSFHQLMKEILDYRVWYEFQLRYQKQGQNMKELTNNEFFKLSGGEKAMCMYMPLFSAVVAKYEGANKEAPRIISLDEAFAGVDENNIEQMFDLMVEMRFNFLINSQILWGDYPTVPSLNIYELLPDYENMTITPIPHHWDGLKKSIILE